MMGRPKEEGLALLDARERRAEKERLRSAAVDRAVQDVLSGDFSCEQAARNRHVPASRVRALVYASKEAV